MKSSTSLKGRLMWVFTSPQARSTITCAGGGGGGEPFTTGLTVAQ